MSLAYEQPPEAVASEKAAREALRLEPTFYNSYYHLGRALILQQRYLEAIAIFQREKELDSTGTFPDLGLGQAYLAQGEYDKALSVMSKAIRPAAVNYYWLGAVYAAHGDKEKALATMQEAFDMAFRDFAVLDASPYFSSLRADARFQQLLQRYRK